MPLHALFTCISVSALSFLCAHAFVVCSCVCQRVTVNSERGWLLRAPIQKVYLGRGWGEGGWGEGQSVEGGGGHCVSVPSVKIRHISMVLSVVLTVKRALWDHGTTNLPNTPIETL